MIDLVAVLTLGIQQMDSEIAHTHTRVSTLESDVHSQYEGMSERVQRMEEFVSRYVREKGIAILENGSALELGFNASGAHLWSSENENAGNASDFGSIESSGASPSFANKDACEEALEARKESEAELNAEASCFEVEKGVNWRIVSENEKRQILRDKIAAILLKRGDEAEGARTLGNEPGGKNFLSAAVNARVDESEVIAL
jgi:hypothetical protein